MKRTIRVIARGGLIVAALFLFPTPARSQVFEQVCPAGTSSFQEFQTFDSATGKSKQNLCIDTLGNMTFQGTTTGGTATGASIITNGLLAYYRALPGETAAGLKDQSGNNNNATATVGTAPTILANTGGISCPGTGAIIIPQLPGALSVQIQTLPTQTGSANEALIMSNNNGAGTTGGVGLILINGNFPGTQVSAQSPSLFGSWRVQTDGGNPASFYAIGNYAISSGWTNVGWAMDTLDRIYVDGVEEFYYNARTGTSAGQNASPFQICGSATGVSVNTYYTGTIKSVLVYNRILNTAEFFTNAVAQCNEAVAAGFTMRCPNDNLLTNYALGTNCRISLDDDSMGNAGGGFLSNPNAGPFQIDMPTAGGACPTWDRVTSSRAGAVASQAVSAEPRTIDKTISATSGENVSNTWFGRNDSCNPSANVVLNNVGSLIWGRKNAGWNYSAPLDMADYTGGDACKNSYNTLFRTYPWPDGAIDLSDPTVSADGASANTDMFSDGTHPTQAGQLNHIGPMVQRFWGRKLGRTNFQSAITYVAPAAAAVATTAGSQAAHIVTVTFAATPANCQAKNTITIAGVTPAAYNGVWWITSRTATTISFFENPLAIGNITVQGTGVCPQQQDADLYQTLNFGAGNYTLASCQGITNMVHYFKNTNAVASTLVAFGTETFDGAGTFTLAANSVSAFMPTVPNSATAGCIWSKVQ